MLTLVVVSDCISVVENRQKILALGEKNKIPRFGNPGTKKNWNKRSHSAP